MATNSHGGVDLFAYYGLLCSKNFNLSNKVLGPVRQSEIKYFGPVYFPILDRCHELRKSARIFYNITVRKPLFAL